MADLWSNCKGCLKNWQVEIGPYDCLCAAFEEKIKGLSEWEERVTPFLSLLLKHSTARQYADNRGLSGQCY